MFKRCSKCYSLKTHREFHNNGTSCYCKSCMSKYLIDYRRSLRESRDEYIRIRPLSYRERRVSSYNKIRLEGVEYNKCLPEIEGLLTL